MAPGRCLRRQGCIELAEITPEVPPYVFQALSDQQMWLVKVQSLTVLANLSVEMQRT